MRVCHTLQEVASFTVFWCQWWLYMCKGRLFWILGILLLLQQCGESGCVCAVSGSGIIYCVSKKETERVSSILEEAKIKSGFYHASVTPAKRRMVQNKWQKGASASHKSIDILLDTLTIDLSVVMTFLSPGQRQDLPMTGQPSGNAILSTGYTAY